MKAAHQNFDDTYASDANKLYFNLCIRLLTVCSITVTIGLFLFAQTLNSRRISLLKHPDSQASSAIATVSKEWESSLSTEWKYCWSRSRLQPHSSVKVAGRPNLKITRMSWTSARSLASRLQQLSAVGRRATTTPTSSVMRIGAWTPMGR